MVELHVLHVTYMLLCYYAICIYNGPATTLNIPPHHPVEDEVEVATATVALTYVAIALITTPARLSS